MRSPKVICLLLVLVTAAVYWPVALNDFVNYDDSDYVTANIHVQGGFSLANVIWAFTTGHASNWHPLTWLSHMTDWQVFGEHAWGHHLVNVAFHIANTLLLFLVLRRMTAAVWRSAFVAALFGLHPLHVESVAWVSERKDVLSGCFFLLTLWAYTRYVESRVHDAQSTVSRPERTVQRPKSKDQSPKPRIKDREPTVRSPQPMEQGQPAAHHAWLYYWISIVLFAFGLMSKPMLVTVPFVLLLLDYWPLQRCGFENQKSKVETFLSLVWEKAPFLILSLVSCAVTFQVQRKGGAVSTILSLGARGGNAVVSYGRYLGKTFWPLDLSVLYPHPGHWPAWEVVVATLLLVAICVAVVVLGRQRPYLVVGWLWFLGTLVPVIGLVQVGIQSMADRYMYVPLIGILIVITWGISEVAPRWTGHANLALGAGLSLMFCAALTMRQILYWRNSETLFLRAVQVTPRNYLAYNNIGFYLSGKGRSAEAIGYYRRSLEINPQYEDALNNMGYALAGQKRYGEAFGFYEEALKVRPDNVEVHNNLGNAFSETGRGNEAIEQYLFVLKHNPEHADAHNNLGIALAMRGNLDEAIIHFRAALRFKPNYASAHSNLGNALAAQHKLDEAISEYQKSLLLNPIDAQAHNNLGNALAELGRLDEAVPQYTEALKLNANNPEAHFNLGLALARLGKREDAVAHLREALRLRPDYEEARQQMEALNPGTQK